MMNKLSLSIGALSKRTGCKVPTIRYYESIGLLEPPYRTEGNQRRYGQSQLSRLTFILHGRELGFSLEDIRELIHLSNAENGHDHQADIIAEKHLKSVQSKIKRLNSLKMELESMLKSCKKDGNQGCKVIDVLSDHQLCHHDHPIDL